MSAIHGGVRCGLNEKCRPPPPHRYLNTWSSVGATVWGKLMEPLGDAHAEVNMSLAMALRFIASPTSVHALFLVC